MSLPEEPRVDPARDDPKPGAPGRGDPGRGDEGRAADALDRLVRGADRRPGWSWPTSFETRIARRPLVALIGVGLVAAVVALVVLQRRPPPIDDRLPRADAAATTVAVADPAGGPPTTAAGAAGDASSTTVAGRIVVHVAGAVTSPGVVEVAGDSRVVDAVHAAGGLLADADPDRVNLAAPLADGQRVVIPAIGQALPAELAPTEPPQGAGPGAGGSAGATTGPIDLNAADAAQLDELPGVGPSTAAAIISHREKEGPFASVDALLDVRGIGEAKLEALRDLVTVGG